MTRATKILNVIYPLIVLLFLLDGLTTFDIRSQPIRSFIYFGYLIGAPVVFVLNLVAIKTGRKRIIGLTFPTLTLAVALWIGPLTILFHKGAWHTQTILYQNGHLSFKKVEFQMQDVGALGYNRRTVEVLYLTPLFMIASEVPGDIDKRIEWVRVDKDVNELGLKFP